MLRLSYREIYLSAWRNSGEVIGYNVFSIYEVFANKNSYGIFWVNEASRMSAVK